MIKQLHPTLKKCACGFIGNKIEFYNHMDQMAEVTEPKEFWRLHGEVPYKLVRLVALPSGAIFMTVNIELARQQDRH